MLCISRTSQVGLATFPMLGGHTQLDSAVPCLDAEDEQVDKVSDIIPLTV